MANPKASSVRSLASRYHLSIKRVDAILRLKGLEKSWIKVCLAFLAALAKFWQDDVSQRLVLKTSKMVILYVSPDYVSFAQI